MVTTGMIRLSSKAILAMIGTVDGSVVRPDDHNPLGGPSGLGGLGSIYGDGDGGLAVHVGNPAFRTDLDVRQTDFPFRFCGRRLDLRKLL